jgi:hypothetical protein
MVMNLSVPIPILTTLSSELGVSYLRVSQLVTLANAGMATGIIFVCPLVSFYLETVAL